MCTRQSMLQTSAYLVRLLQATLDTGTVCRLLHKCSQQEDRLQIIIQALMRLLCSEAGAWP